MRHDIDVARIGIRDKELRTIIRAADAVSVGMAVAKGRVMTGEDIGIGDTQRPRHTSHRQPGPPEALLIFAILGLSFLWPCLGSAATMSFRHAMANSASVITGEWHAVVMGAMYLVAIVICLADRRRIAQGLLVSGARFMLIFGTCGIVGHVLLVMSPLMGDSVPLVTAVVVFGFAVSIIFLVGSVLAWGFLLGELPVMHAVLAVVASTALSYGLQSVLNVISHGTLLIYLVICPVFCALLGWRCARATTRVDTVDEEEMGLGSALRGLPWKIMGPTIVLIYFEQAFSSLLFKRYVDWPQDNITVTLVAGCVVWAIVTLCMIRFFRQIPDGREAGRDMGMYGDARRMSEGAGQAGISRSSASRLSHRLDTSQMTVFAALLVFYMAALLAIVVFPSSSSLIIERLLVAAGSSFRVLVWVSVLCAIWRRKTTTVVGYLAYVFFILALPVSRLTALLFDRLDTATVAFLASPAVIVPTAGVMIFLIAAVFIVASMRRTRSAANDPDGSGADVSAEPDATCQAIAHEAGLSTRETDVLELICRGYTAKRAGDKLGISESTVVSHMTHIYRKLGVSSKQELVSLVEERRG